VQPAEILHHLHLWPGLADARASLINHSENHTYRLDLPSGQRSILRLHRPGYQDSASILSELQWVAALGAETDVPVPGPLPGRDGGLLQNVGTTARPRWAVLFDYKPGETPDESVPPPAALFRELGRLAASCHLHAMAWRRPPGFVRPEWTIEAMLGVDGLWGDWRRAPNLEPAHLPLLEEAVPALAARFAGYGRGRDRFALIHADMRLANLLIDGTRVRLLDFDDCGFGWLVYDFASAVSFFEDSPHVPELKAMWCAGYAERRSLTPADLEMMDPAVLARRMLLLAWIGSHGETPLAQAHATQFAAGTARMARRFLDGLPLT